MTPCSLLDYRRPHVMSDACQMFEVRYACFLGRLPRLHMSLREAMVHTLLLRCIHGWLLLLLLGRQLALHRGHLLLVRLLLVHGVRLRRCIGLPLRRRAVLHLLWRRLLLRLHAQDSASGHREHTAHHTCMLILHLHATAMSICRKLAREQVRA